MAAGFDHANLLSCAPIETELHCIGLRERFTGQARSQIDIRGSVHYMTPQLEDLAAPEHVPVGCLLHGSTIKYHRGESRVESASVEHVVSCSEDWGCICECRPGSAAAEE